MTRMRFTLDSSSPSLWRVTFNNPPINLIDSVMIGELSELFARVERDEGPAVFDRQALADIKRFINNVSLPPEKEFPPQMDAFWQSVARPAMQARARKAFEDGLQQRSDVERRLGEYVGKFADNIAAEPANVGQVADAPYRSGSERT